jgi:hypothetical protein
MAIPNKLRSQWRRRAPEKIGFLRTGRRHGDQPAPQGFRQSVENGMHHLPQLRISPGNTRSNA